MEKLSLASFKEKVFDYTAAVNDHVEWQYKGTMPAIIDFYADWCGPCKMVGPVLEELERDGKFILYKVDIDAEAELAAMFGIMSIPSMLFIPLKGPPTMLTGARPRQELEEQLIKIL